MKKLNLPEDEICKLYESGMSANKISDKYGCSDKVIARILKSNDIKIRSPSEARKGLLLGSDNGRWLNLSESDICKLFLNNITIKNISNIYNCSIPTIRVILLKNNIKIMGVGLSNKGRKASNKTREK